MAVDPVINWLSGTVRTLLNRMAELEGKLKDYEDAVTSRKSASTISLYNSLFLSTPLDASAPDFTPCSASGVAPAQCGQYSQDGDNDNSLERYSRYADLQALEQSGRYADLSLPKEELLTGTASPLESFENEFGVQTPGGFWNPLGLSRDSEVVSFNRQRETEIKHDCMSVLATMGYITPDLLGKLPNYLSPSMGLKFDGEGPEFESVNGNGDDVAPQIIESVDGNGDDNGIDIGFSDLCLQEADLLKDGKHVLVSYFLKPEAGTDYLSVAARLAAASSASPNANICSTNDYTMTEKAKVYHFDPEAEEAKIAYPVCRFYRSIGPFANICSTNARTITENAKVYYIGPEAEVANIAYPVSHFNRNILVGRAMMCSMLALPGLLEYGKIFEVYFPPEFLCLFDGPSRNAYDIWRILGQGTSDGMTVGKIIKPKLGLQSKPLDQACSAYWQGGDLIPSISEGTPDPCTAFAADADKSKQCMDQSVPLSPDIDKSVRCKSLSGEGPDSIYSVSPGGEGAADVTKRVHCRSSSGEGPASALKYDEPQSNQVFCGSSSGSKNDELDQEGNQQQRISALSMLKNITQRAAEGQNVFADLYRMAHAVQLQRPLKEHLQQIRPMLDNCISPSLVDKSFELASEWNPDSFIGWWFERLQLWGDEQLEEISQINQALILLLMVCLQP